MYNTLENVHLLDIFQIHGPVSGGDTPTPPCVRACTEVNVSKFEWNDECEWAVSGFGSYGVHKVYS